MIFVPLGAAGLDRLLADGQLAATAAFTATPALRTDHDLGPRDDEDADFVAFRYACIQAIADAEVSPDGARLGRIVVAADVPAADVSVADADRLGRVTVTAVRLRDVTAVYLDEEAARPALIAARSVVDASTDLGEVTETAEVTDLLDEHAMLWHLPTEVAD